MRDKLTEIGCVWVRRIKAMLNGKIFHILLGYIINEEQVAVPYAAVVDARLSSQELQDLKESLRLSQPVTIGEYNNEWQWRTWNGAPIDALPSIESPHQIMNRAADINMVFIELFTSLKGLGWKPSILRELVNAGLLTRIYLYQQNKADRWQDLKECPHQFPILVMQAMRELSIPQISFLPFINDDVVRKLVDHLSVLPLQSLQLAKSYLSLSMASLKEEFNLTNSPSYWVEDILEEMKKDNLMTGHVMDLSSIFTSKLLYCTDASSVTELTAIEESSHYTLQAKVFHLLLGDERLTLKEQWHNEDRADTVIAELNTDNVFRLIPECSTTLRSGGYGCWFMESKLSPLVSALLHTDSSNYQLIKKVNYESTHLGNWTAFIFHKPEEEIQC